MCKLSFSFDHCGSPDNFELAQEIDGNNICSILNAFIRFLHTMGYADELITDMIGTTYFDEDMYDDLKAATNEAVDEYIASRDASDKRLDNNKDYPEI